MWSAYEFSFATCFLQLSILGFNIFKISLSMKCTYSFCPCSLQFSTLTFCGKAWMWSTVLLLSLFLLTFDNAMGAHYILFLLFLLCDFICCNCWNILPIFLMILNIGSLLCCYNWWLLQFLKRGGVNSLL